LELSADDTNGACKPTAISACRRFVGSFRQATPAMVSTCGISAKAQGRRENLNCSVDSTLSIRTRLTLRSATIEVASVDSRNSSANMRKNKMKDAHNKAAEHHESAAKSHRAAAESHGKNDHAKGKEHATQAQQHAQNANEHSKTANTKSDQQK
jgi:hypothetical protein